MNLPSPETIAAYSTRLSFENPPTRKQGRPQKYIGGFDKHCQRKGLTVDGKPRTNTPRPKLKAMGLVSGTPEYKREYMRLIRAEQKAK